MSAQFLLPAIAAFATLLAAIAAITAWLARTDRRQSRLTLWDGAGACALIGIVAGVLSRPDYVTQFFGVATSMN
jgi:hypothetical protein